MKDIINVKLSQYLVNEITQEQLNKWAIDMLHQMLKGDVFQLSILEVWGIITELAGAGDLEKELCDNLVQQFSDILSGKIQAAFSVAVQIPNKLVMKDLVHVKDILQKYMQKKTLSKIEIQKLKLVVKEKVCPVNTLSQMLKEQIIGLLKLGYDFDLEDSDMIFDLKSTLFIHYDIERALEGALLSKIIQLLDCYNGEKCFFVNIRYEKGGGKYIYSALKLKYRLIKMIVCIGDSRVYFRLHRSKNLALVSLFLCFLTCIFGKISAENTQESPRQTIKIISRYF